MKLLQTTGLTLSQKESLRHMWNSEYPAKLAHATAQNMDDYLSTLSNATHYIAMNGDTMAAWAATFFRDSEVWFAIIVAGSYQKQRLGCLLLNTLKSNNEVLNGWVADHNNDLKADGTTYISPLPFYLKNGFTICEGVRMELEKLSAAKIRWVRS